MAYFHPSYKTTKTSGYHLPVGKHIKRSYVNYTRGGASLTGGRIYSKTAKSKKSTKEYYAESPIVYDSFDANAPVTKFNYDWVPF
jgi:hypothetical protein